MAAQQRPVGRAAMRRIGGESMPGGDAAGAIAASLELKN